MFIPAKSVDVEHLSQAYSAGSHTSVRRVSELAPGMTGRWLVATQGSTHEWNLDTLTYMRIPGPDSLSGPFTLDLERIRITRVSRWPCVGSTTLLFYDDPMRPFDLEHWRQSSRIDSMTELPTTTDTWAAAGCGGRMKYPEKPRGVSSEPAPRDIVRPATSLPVSAAAALSQIVEKQCNYQHFSGRACLEDWVGHCSRDHALVVAHHCDPKETTVQRI